MHVRPQSEGEGEEDIWGGVAPVNMTQRGVVPVNMECTCLHILQYNMYCIHQNAHKHYLNIHGKISNKKSMIYAQYWLPLLPTELLQHKFLFQYSNS